MRPFSEVNLWEQNQPVTGSFFSTGSAISIGETPGSFSGPLKNKEQIKFTFNVKNPVKMLPKSASIYYFNITEGQWNIPANSVSDHVGPFDCFAYPTNWSNPSGTVSPPTSYGYTLGTQIIEDAKCFDYKGRSCVSGSNSVYRQINSSISNFSFNQKTDFTSYSGESTDFSSNFKLKYMTDDYPASVQRSETYNASKNEIFSADTQLPFLIEKCVLSVPICLGPSWFSDKTIVTVPGASGTITVSSPASNDPDPNVPIGINASNIYIDTGGPALTFGLFCQKNFGTSSIRDLIVSGTVSHINDNKSFLTNETKYYFSATAKQGIASLQGMQPTVMLFNNNDFFTGSVELNLTPTISNGVATAGIILYDLTGSREIGVTPDDSITPEELIQKYTTLTSQPRVVISQLKKHTAKFTPILTSLDAFGRAQSGFAPSGGSIFGGEHVSPSDYRDFNNPFYIPDESLRNNSIISLSQSITATIQSAGWSYPYTLPGRLASYVVAFDLEDFSAAKESPYLLNPGDKLLLSISKCRPAISASGHRINKGTDCDVGRHTLTKEIFAIPGAQNGHDVTLATGSIELTLYGSYVKRGDSYIP